MSGPSPKDQLTKSERVRLRELADQAWETELHAALSTLYEEFGKWAEKGLSSFDLSDRIHKFHNGEARDLYKLYMSSNKAMLVSRAIARGVIAESALTTELAGKLSERVQDIRDWGKMESVDDNESD